MKGYIIKVTKLTDVELLRTCASFTSGRDCKMSLMTAYRNKHSIIRSQLFVIEMTDIPLFCASQFVRSTQGVNWYQRTKRTDRGGEDFGIECYDFGQRLDIVAGKIDIDLFEQEADALTQALAEMESEVKHWPERFDRYAQTDLCGIMNAEAIMNMSEKRLCQQASRETREIWQQVLREVAKVDPDLVKFCVRPCVSHGGICRESKCCGFNKTERFNKIYIEYKKNFTALSFAPK